MPSVCLDCDQGDLHYLNDVPRKCLYLIDVVRVCVQEAGLVILSLSHDVGLGHYIPTYQDLLPAALASVPFL